MRKKPAAGEFYRHFKGELYQVKTLARDSETQKELVVYQAMYEPFDCWVRPLTAFLSEVDREKYPDVRQQYRFEKAVLQETVCRNEKNADMIDELQSERGTAKELCSEGERTALSDRELVKALKSGQPERYLRGRETEADIAQRGLLLLLDASAYQEKRQIFAGLKQYLDQRMLNNIAVALDIVLEDGSMEEQYESVMRCLEAFEHYEGGRLR